MKKQSSVGLLHTPNSGRLRPSPAVRLQLGKILFSLRSRGLEGVAVLTNTCLIFGNCISVNNQLSTERPGTGLLMQKACLDHSYLLRQQRRDVHWLPRAHERALKEIWAKMMSLGHHRTQKQSYFTRDVFVDSKQMGVEALQHGVRHFNFCKPYQTSQESHQRVPSQQSVLRTTNVPPPLSYLQPNSPTLRQCWGSAFSDLRLLWHPLLP